MVLTSASTYGFSACGRRRSVEWLVQTWCRALPAGASVLDLGCGAGVPVSETLMAERCVVSGIDASPTLVAAYRQRFPQAQVACEPAEESDFFGRTYDGIVAIGLIFLLQPAAQHVVIRRAAAAVNPGGRFLFTAPTQSLVVMAEYVDEGESHYYDAGRAPR